MGEPTADRELDWAEDHYGKIIADLTVERDRYKAALEKMVKMPLATSEMNSATKEFKDRARLALFPTRQST